MIALFERRTSASATQAEVKRAHAHRLLDDLVAGNSGASDEEIAAALRTTGDARPVVREMHGLGFRRGLGAQASLQGVNAMT